MYKSKKDRQREAEERQEKRDQRTKGMQEAAKNHETLKNKIAATLCKESRKRKTPPHFFEKEFEEGGF